MADKWFTFGYNNTSAWKEKCSGCGGTFPRENLVRVGRSIRMNVQTGRESHPPCYLCVDCAKKRGFKT